MKKIFFNLAVLRNFLILLFLSSCGGGSSSGVNELDSSLVNIYLTGLKTQSNSYESQVIEITSNISECTFNISLKDEDFYKIHNIQTNDNKNFTFRNPISYTPSENFELNISTNPNTNCPKSARNFNLQVDKHPTQYELIPTNISDLKTDIYEIGDIGFGGIVINDTFSATICYPTPNDCESFENALFGQDAHNMASGDFNGDGYEDFVVAWALFPHTIEPDQKIDAPINIYLNNGDGRFREDFDIYIDDSAPTHPFAYRTVVADFNNDGIDDIFSSSMGIQYRSDNYNENYIDPFPHLLLLSNSEGKFENKSHQIEGRK